MLKTQYPVGYLKKEGFNSKIIDQLEKKQHINEKIDHIRSKRSDPQAEQSAMPRFDNKCNSWQIHVPIDDSLFYSTTLACLVSAKDKDSDFRNRFESLFGNANLDKLDQIKVLIQDYNPFLNAKDVYENAVLNELIQSFRNRVANYRPSVAGRSMNELQKISAVLNCKIIGLGNDIYAFRQGSPNFELKLLKRSSNHYDFWLEKDIGKKYKQLWEVDQRLVQFTKKFTLVYETLLSQYNQRLEERISKPGKYADLFRGTTEVLGGGPELSGIIESSAESAMIKVGGSLLLKVFGSIASSVGSYTNREELKKLTEHLYIFEKNPAEARKKLVEAGVDIFQSFESQFMEVTAKDKNWQRAMTKLAHDASNRVVSYYKKNPGEEFAVSSITKGVILGMSKEYKDISTGRPHFTKGHSLINKKSRSWNTAELFEGPGLVAVGPNGEKSYYKGSKGEKYGYRLLFEWEHLTPSNRKYTVNGKEYVSSTPGDRYSYLLKKEKLSDKQRTILDEVNHQDPQLMEERLKEALEEVNQDIKKSLDRLEQHIERNYKELLTYVRNNHDEVKRLFDEAKSEHQEIAHSIEEARIENKELHEKTQAGVENANQGINNLQKGQEVIINEIRTLGKKDQDKKPVWFEVREPVKSFTGRQEQLDRIATAIKQEIAVISGLGGIGKSELAIKYVHDRNMDYDGNVVWVNAETRVSAKGSFRELAKKILNIPTTEKIDGNVQERDIKFIAKDVYKYFSGVKSLFIFDNAEEYKNIKEFLPYSLHPNDKKPYILITSRNQDWKMEEKRICVIPLDGFTQEEAKKFVKDFLKIEDGLQEEDIEKLTKELQYFPLALRQAVVYIEQENEKEKKWKDREFKISNYLEKYQQSSELLNRGRYKNDDRYTRTVFTTWDVTINKIKEDQESGKQAIGVFNIMAYLVPDEIKIREVFPKLAVEDEEKLQDAVELLNRYSMISLRKGVSSIHRLVQQVTKIKLEAEFKEEEVLEEALKLFKDDINPNNVDHSVSVWNNVSKYKELVKNFSELPSQIIRELSGAIRYERACSFGKEALELLGGILDDKDDPNILSTMYEMAGVFYKQGKYDGALGIFQEVYEKRKEKLGENHPSTLATKDSIASVLYKQGKYEEALEAYEEVLKGRKEKLGLDHPGTLSTMSSIATVLNNKGEYEEALQVLNKVYEVQKNTLGPDDPKTLFTMHEKARALDNLGRYRDAIEAYREVLDKRTQILGPNDPFTLHTLHGLGRALSNQGEYEQALEKYEEALERRREKLGSDNPDSLATMNNKAVVLNKQGKYDEALKVYKEVLEKRKEKLGLDHPSTLYTLHGMAKVLSNQGKYDEALEAFQDVLKKRIRVLGPDQPATLSTMHEIAGVLGEQRKYEEALEKYKEVLEKREKVLSQDHPSTLSTKNGIAEVLGKQGKYDGALGIFQEVYEKRKEKLGENHPSTLATKDSIDRLSQLQLRSSGEQQLQIDEVSAEECLPNNRRKREAKGECLFTWEDVDEFNLEKDEKRDLSKIKIDSDKFIDYIKDLPEGKRSQLIQLADKVQVTDGLVNKLISNQKIMSHLNRVGRVSSMTMHGMMAKNVLADFLNGNYQGVAINVGFIAGGQGFAKVAEATSFKGLKLASEGKLLLGRSLKAASPFLARGTSAFVIYDLVNQVKEFKNGTEEALVGVVGDSIYLGVDAAEIGIEVAEAFEVLEEVSSVTGPIGATIGAVVFVGTDIYMAVKRVDKIDEFIHLTGKKERFVEGLRAFIGMQPEKHIEELMQEKEVSNELVRQGLEYLKEHSDIQSYVFPTGKSVVDSCRKVPYKTSVCDSGGLGGRCLKTRTIKRYTEKCTTKFEVDLDNTVLLDEKRTDIKWSRARPDDPSGGELFCLPQGSHEPAPSYGSYLCENAIGVTDLSAKTGNRTLINLGEGIDHAKGFRDSPNIFLVSKGNKRYIGGDKDDIFILQGSFITGYLHGEGGVNTLDFTSFAPEEESIDAKLYIGRVEDYYRNNFFGMSEINKFLGRKAKADQIFITCDSDTNDVKFVDGQGGSERLVDNIKIYDKDCAYEMQIVVRPDTVIYNRALKGDFHYIVPYALGSAKVDFVYTAEVLNLSNTFTFEYEPIEIGNIDVRNINVLNKTSHIITFNFSPASDKEFNITISGASNPSYRLGNNTEIKVGNRGNLYMLENTNQSVEEIIKNYLVVANRLNKMSFFIQSLLSNETVAIGSGNYEVIHNNPLHKSHLVGNGGENVYVIDSESKRFEIPLPEVVIYDLDVESSVDTIDLRNLVQQARGEFSSSFKLQVLKSANDLLLKATVEKPTEDSSISEVRRHEYFTVRLKDGVNWYNKTHVIMDNVPMRISLDNNEWSLKPQPLMFEKDKEVIVVTSQDVEENTELITPRRAGNYSFIKNNGTDLMITNAFDTQDDLCTIVLSKFYETPKMETLSIKFADKEIILRDHQEQISTARDVDIVKREHKEQVYSDVFNRTSSSEPHRYQVRHRRSTNSSARPSSWINDLFGWVKSSIGGLFGSRVALPEEKLNTKSSISQPMDVNGTIILLDVLVRKVTGQKYISIVDQSISPLEAQGYALNITEGFEKVIEQAARNSNISTHRLNIDFVKIQKEVTGKIMSGKFNEISGVLNSYVEKACPGREAGKLSSKKFDKLMVEFNSRLNVVLSQPMQQMLHNKNSTLEISDEQINSGPKSYLNNTSVQGHLTQARDLGLR